MEEIVALLTIIIIFADRLLSVFFVFIPVLLLFAFFNKKLFKLDSSHIFSLIALLACIAIRLMIGRTSHRYLNVIPILALPFAVLGFSVMVDWIFRILEKHVKALKRKHITIALLSIIAIASIGKALNPPAPKTHIRNFINAIKDTQQDMQNKNNAIILASGKYGSRIAYYTKTIYKELPPCKNQKDFSNILVAIVRHLLTNYPKHDLFIISPINHDALTNYCPELASLHLLQNYKNKLFLFHYSPFRKFKTYNTTSLPVKKFTGKFDCVSKSGTKIYNIPASSTLVGAKFISVSPNYIYRLSGLFKSTGKQKSHLNFGYIPFNHEKKFISSSSVNGVWDSISELAKNCSANDRIVFLKSAKNWSAGKINCIAFGADLEQKDIPNFNLSSLGIAKIQKGDNCWKVFLFDKCGKTFPAGTKVRLHCSKNTYIYNAASNFQVPRSWTKYEGLISTNKAVLLSQLPTGTAFVKILILTNTDEKPHKESNLEAKNIFLEEIKYPGQSNK